MVPLIRLIRYISYSPSLVTRQLRGIQYMLRTRVLTEYTRLFKNFDYLTKLEAIIRDWGQLVLVRKGEHKGESLVSSNYSIWRSGGLFKVLRSMGI